MSRFDLKKLKPDGQVGVVWESGHEEPLVIENERNHVTWRRIRLSRKAIWLVSLSEGNSASESAGLIIGKRANWNAGSHVFRCKLVLILSSFFDLFLCIRVLPLRFVTYRFGAVML
jgi:hypothetical protein